MVCLLRSRLIQYIETFGPREYATNDIYVHIEAARVSAKSVSQIRWSIGRRRSRLFGRGGHLRRDAAAGTGIASDRTSTGPRGCISDITVVRRHRRNQKNLTMPYKRIIIYGSSYNVCRSGA